MTSSVEAVREAAGALERLSDVTPGERGRRATVVALVLRYVEWVMDARPAPEFMRRRAQAEVDRLTSGSERGILRRLIETVECGSGAGADVLNEYCVGLEEARRLEEADAVVRLARALAPSRSDLALRAGRIARLRRDRERALEEYGIASQLDGEDGLIARLAMVGQAVVAADPEKALSKAARQAIRAGENEAAAVALEERAQFRRGRGDRSGAARDLCIAACRYGDAVDRTRVAHELADLFIGAGEPAAACTTLSLALRMGDRWQRDHARSRLHTLARDRGDELGMRRWRSFDRPRLVSMAARGAAARSELAAVRSMNRWRDRIEQLLTAPAT